MISTTGRVTLLFLLLSVILTWPLAANLTTQVIGPFHGDNLEYVWKIWWVKHALLDLGQSPLLQPEVYYPYGYPLAYGEITPIHTYVGVPFTALLGPIATYNLFILTSFVTSGLFCYLFVRELTGSAPAGVLAGVVFAFCPYRMARVAGNLPLVDTQWIPLFILFLERFSSRHRRRDAVLAGLVFAAGALSSWYYGLALATLAPLYLLARTRPRQRGDWQRWVQGALFFTVTAAVLVLPFLLPYFEIQQSGAATVPLEQAAFWSASLTDYLTPNPRHVWWGEWVQNQLTPFSDGLPYEFLLGWGLFPTILALYGWRRGDSAARRGWGWWIGIALLLSLGPVVMVFRQVVALPATAGLATAVNNGLDWLGTHSLAGEPFSLAAAGHIAIPLPALLLRWFVPGLAGIRSWGRFAIFATFGIATLGGIGTATFLRERESKSPGRPTWQQWGVTCVLAGLVVFEFFTGRQSLISPGPRPVDEWLANQPDQVTLIQMPLVVALSGPQMYYTMHHGQRVAGGYGTYLPILFETWYPELKEFPSDEAIELLAGWDGGGVDLVLIDEADVPAGDPIWEAVAGQSRLQLETTVNRVRVYRIQ